MCRFNKISELARNFVLYLLIVQWLHGLNLPGEHHHTIGRPRMAHLEPLLSELLLSVPHCLDKPITVIDIQGDSDCVIFNRLHS